MLTQKKLTYILIYISLKILVQYLLTALEYLFTRGDKLNSLEAPINEVLAAGLILLSDWDKILDFHDPMCGSGTILIEAAMIAQNIPVNIFRKSSAFKSGKTLILIYGRKLKMYL